MDIPILYSNNDINNKDLCLLFINLLSNAIEAARGHVHVRMCQVHKMLLIEVINDFKEKPNGDRTKLRTTKNDKDKHGWGIRIIESIVNKYDGNLEYRVDDSRVHVEIMING